MVNLVPAICPCCGGQLELDDNMKRAECQYCKNTIIVDEAIEKFKTDSNGNLKISGIKDLDKYLEEARKNFKIKKYRDANVCCNQVLNLDRFNDEASIIKVESFLAIVDGIENYEDKLKEGDDDAWISGDALLDCYKNLENVMNANGTQNTDLKRLGNDKVERCKYIFNLLDTIENPNECSVAKKNINNILKKYKEFVKTKSVSMISAYLNDLLKLEYKITFDDYKVSSLKFDFDDMKRLFFSYDSKFGSEVHNHKLYILAKDYKNPKELYDKLVSTYDIMCERYDYSVKIRDKANEFLKGGNFLTRPKRLKYLCESLGIYAYEKDFHFVVINDFKIGGFYHHDELESYSNLGLKTEDVEKLISDYK